MEPASDIWIAPDPDAIVHALAEGGAGGLDPGELSVLTRDDRYAVRLPNDRMAWFPSNARGLIRLQRERRVLELIAKHCGFAAPQVIHESAAGWDLRRLVAGPFEPQRVYERVKADTSFARTVGAGMGAVLAEQHTAIPAAALGGGWLPSKPSWPPPIGVAMQQLPAVTDDKALIDRALELLRRYEREEDRVAGRVLGHTDFGFHNTVIDVQTGQVLGVFDYDGAAHCDRLHDFRYLLLDDENEALLEGAMSAYEPATGQKLDRGRIRMLNAACAVAFLAFRAGSAPDDRPAGRTLAEDLRWTRLALQKAGA